MGQRTDTTIAAARTNNTYEGLTLGTLPFKEMKLLYRVILRNDATPYEEVADYRAVSNISTGAYVATLHSALTGLNWAAAGHTFDTTLDTGAQAITTTGAVTGGHVFCSDLTAGRVTFATTSGELADDADLTFSGATLSATNVSSSGTVTWGSVSLTSVNAAGTGGATAQSDATGLTALYNRVGDCDSVRGVRLPDAVAGLACNVFVYSTTDSVQIFPASGDQISGAGGANNPITGAAARWYSFVALDGSIWVYLS
jgi:hypothetical protein